MHSTMGPARPAVIEFMAFLRSEGLQAIADS
jgi:hypothetical protein